MSIPIETRPVGPPELQAMFRILAGVDGHQRSGDDVEAWILASRGGRWTCAQLAAATLILARSFTGFRIMPGHVDEQITSVREQVRTRWYCPDPPRELADDPAAEIAWRRDAAADYTDRALYALATGTPLDEVPMTRDSEPDVPELADRRERMEQIAGEIGRGKAIPAESTPAERPTVDPQRMADARDELDVARRNTTAATA